MDDSGETVVLSGDDICDGDECVEPNIEPDIDITEINEPEEIEEEPEPVICDEETDNDGDGIPCSCDGDDENANDYSLEYDCDKDGDAIPKWYDGCGNIDNTEDVTVIYLCDDFEIIPGIRFDVDYDHSLWSKDNCPETDFPIAYVLPDENDNGNPDSCDFSRTDGLLVIDF